jgi:hypothetical protein
LDFAKGKILPQYLTYENRYHTSYLAFVNAKIGDLKGLIEIGKKFDKNIWVMRVPSLPKNYVAAA